MEMGFSIFLEGEFINGSDSICDIINVVNNNVIQCSLEDHNV